MFEGQKYRVLIFFVSSRPSTSEVPLSESSTMSYQPGIFIPPLSVIGLEGLQTSEMHS
jgi:hypothetical protein